MGVSLKKGDTVMVITGKEKGKTGKILKFFTENNRVLIEKLNMVKKHLKPSQKNPQGGIIEKEATIHRSNIMYYEQKLGKPTRLGAKILKDGKKVRVSRKSGEVLDK